MKRTKTFLNSLLIIIGSIVLCTLLMILVYTLPTDRAYNYAKNSSDLFSTNMFKTWSGNNRYAKIDTTSDAIMVDIALCRYYSSPIENAMLNPMHEFGEDGDDPHQKALVSFLEGDTINDYSNYARYWHGYVLFMLPLLSFVDIGGLKMMMLIAQLLLLILVSYEFGKRNIVSMLMFSFVILFINPISTALSFEYASCYLISLLFTYLVLKFNDYFLNNKYYIYLFTICGVLTSFLDLLTFPLVTWGLPLLSYLLINENNIKKDFVFVINVSLSWIFGYVGMWLGKLVVGSLLTNTNIIADAIKEFAFRTNGNVAITFDSYFTRLITAFDNPIIFMLLLSIVLLATYVVINIKRINFLQTRLIDLLPIVIVSLSPFVWLFVVKQHSIEHPWLAYRNLSILLWGIYVIIIKLICNRKDSINEKEQ